MTREAAKKEYLRLHEIVKNWRAKDAWHEAVRDRNDELVDYLFCTNGKEPGPWEMPPIPEGVEP